MAADAHMCGKGGVTRGGGELSPEKIPGSLHAGSSFELDNGWRMVTARITGDEVVELVLNCIPANREELIGYGFSEEIIHYKRRCFIVTAEATKVLVRRLTHRKPNGKGSLVGCPGKPAVSRRVTRSQALSLQFRSVHLV